MAASLRSLHGGNHVSPVGPFFLVLCSRQTRHCCAGSAVPAPRRRPRSVKPGPGLGSDPCFLGTAWGLTPLLSGRHVDVSSAESYYLQIGMGATPHAVEERFLYEIIST